MGSLRCWDPYRLSVRHSTHRAWHFLDGILFNREKFQRPLLTCSHQFDLFFWADKWLYFTRHTGNSSRLVNNNKLKSYAYLLKMVCLGSFWSMQGSITVMKKETFAEITIPPRKYMSNTKKYTINVS